jgi:predicted ATPase
MKVRRLFFNNYKSLINFELIEPNAFSVFVGPNAAGKSNIFEGIEFLNFFMRFSQEASALFGTPANYLNKQFSFTTDRQTAGVKLEIDIDETRISRLLSCRLENDTVNYVAYNPGGGIDEDSEIFKEKSKEFIEGFSRIFVNKSNLVRLNTNGSGKLRTDAANLEAVLHRIFEDLSKREEIIEWLQMLVPELDKVEIIKSNLSKEYFLKVYEKHLPNYIGKDLISDGTFHILAMLAAVYQSDEPQFICIEEPENGLNPYVIRTLVEFFRSVCQQKGHNIWLNTHSPIVVRALKNEEIILVDKKNGVTRAKQIAKDFNRHDLTLDEAWLSNALGGGLPW